MNIQKVILLSFGILISSKFGNAATQKPHLVGLRCEFNGNIEFSITQGIFEQSNITETEMQVKTPELLYDASKICDVVIEKYMNGTGMRYKCNLEPSQWIWLMNSTPIRVTLKPNLQRTIYPHSDVYFYNIFNKPFHFSLSKVEFEEFKCLISIKSDDREITLASIASCYEDETNRYHFTLTPGMAIRYPGESRLNLALENESK
ncbi:MAG: hypothetical protein WC192_04725 [Candidatus Babeliales bacterium]|jgi:hypothetical protein